MIRITFSLLVLIMLTGKISAQQTSLSLFLGYQKNDKRFFTHHVDPWGKKEIWGTTYYGFSVNNNLSILDRLNVQLGVGYAREVNTYSTPYDFCFNHPGEACVEILVRIQTYMIDLVRTSFSPQLFITRGLSVRMEIVPQFNFYKAVKGHGITSDFGFGLYSVEFNPSVDLRLGKSTIGLGYRLYQMKTIDPVYLYGNVFLRDNPGYLDRSFDTYNPMKVMVMYGISL